MTNDDFKGVVPKKTKDAYGRIKYWANKDLEWRGSCINLIASENIASPAVKQALSTDFGGRYAEGRPGKRYYQGTWMFDEIEAIGTELMKRLFDCDHADLMPISGAVANMAAFSAFGSKGDKVASIPLEDGAHISHVDVSIAGLMGLKNIELPFDEGEMNIDIEASKKVILEKKPKIVILGGSMYLFPHPVKEIKSACEEVDAKIVYDAAHVAGLIAGKQFDDPLPDGADVITFSTHKSFPGPQGGALVYNDSVGEENVKKLQEATFPKLMSNHHLHHVVGKAITAAEMLEFGEKYAKQIIKNSKALAERLHNLGLKVLAENKGFTKSHQVLVDVRPQGGKAAAETLEKANIIVSKQILPGTTVDADNPAGLRLGTQELTRLGMKQRDMETVAGFIKQTLIDKKDPKTISEEVVKFIRQFNAVLYCFDRGKAYEHFLEL